MESSKHLWHRILKCIFWPKESANENVGLPPNLRAVRFTPQKYGRFSFDPNMEVDRWDQSFWSMQEVYEADNKIRY